MIVTKALTKYNTQKWKATMEEKMSFLKKNNTWIHIVKAFNKTIKQLAASGCFELRGMLMVKLYATRQNS